MEIAIFTILAFICIGGLGASYLVYKAVIDRLDKIEAQKAVLISQVNELTSKINEREAVEQAVGQIMSDLHLQQDGEFEEMFPLEDEDLN